MFNENQFLFVRRIAVFVFLSILFALYVNRSAIKDAFSERFLLWHSVPASSMDIGIFSPEAAERCDMGLSLFSLQYRDNFDRYHREIRVLYGRDMSDYCYFSAASEPGWRQRCIALKGWIFNAARYGAPTIALEPNGPTKYRIVGDNEEMRTLKSIFMDARRHHIKLWIRFASEFNLSSSPYSIARHRSDIKTYKVAARCFHLYMPENIYLVYSPLINTAYERTNTQLRILRESYEPGIYARIGGTLYATTKCDPITAFDWYYKFMRNLDPKTPFQICEFEGMLDDKQTSLLFLKLVFSNTWPKVEKINLFAGTINKRAEKEYSAFGWVEHDADSSFAHAILSRNSIEACQ
jgi:hypothetical protein